MRRVALLVIGVLLLVLLMAPTASAHTAGPVRRLRRRRLPVGH